MSDTTPRPVAGGRKAPWDSPEESAAQIRALNSEAFQFLGFALASYSVELAFVAGVATGGVHHFPFMGALALVLLADLLTGFFAAAVMARYDLSSLIFEWWPPWVYAEEMIRRAISEGKTDGTRLDIRFVGAWFHKERVLFGGRTPQSTADRVLFRAKGVRQAFGAVLVGVALALPGWWVLSLTWGNGWPF